MARIGHRPPAPEGVVPTFLAGCADPTCLAGQADCGASADAALTFAPDHSMGADQAHVQMLPQPTQPRQCWL